MRFLEKRSLHIFSGVLLFAACVAYVALTFEWREIIRLLGLSKYVFFVSCCSASILTLLALRAYRWQVMLRRLDCRIPFLDVYLCSSVCVTLALITPMRSGELLKVELLKRHNLLSRVDGYSSFLVERIADLMLVGILSLLAVFLKFRAVLPAKRLILAIAGFLALLILVLFLAPRLRFGPVTKKFAMLFRVMTRDPGLMLKVLVLTALIWVMVAVGWKIALSSVLVQVNLAELLGLICVITAAAVLSMIPGSLGVYEVGITVFLIKIGQDPALAQTGSLAIRAYSLLLLLWGGVHFFLWQLRVRRRASIGAAGVN